MSVIVPELPWTLDQVKAEAVSKKDVIKWLQEHASFTFLAEKKLKGQLNNIAKVKSKDDCVKYYTELMESKDYRKEGEVDQTTKPAADKTTEQQVKQVTTQAKALSVKDEQPKYKKVILKKGNNSDYPKKGDTVKVYYKGKLENGTVFDTNMESKKGSKAEPLSFKVGKGIVIRGWDEALLTMSVGESAQVTIEPEWAYGKKGLEGKIPPNATLIFDVELVSVE